MTAQKFLWPATDDIPRLEADQIHVWAWNLDRQPTPAEWALLDPEETRRASRFADPQDRDRFVRAHAATRRLLGSYAQVEPAAIRYSKNIDGKPEIPAAEGVPHSARVHFNLSHSADVAVLAVSAQDELGVDIETVRPIDSQVAKRYFSPLELQTLQDLPPEMWLRGFFRCWTSKEALLKGEGSGLRLPIHSFDVEADPRRNPALLAVRPQARIRAHWRLLDLQPVSGVAGTLAIQSGERSAPQCFTFLG